MTVALVWFAEQELSEERSRALWRRIDEELAALVPEGYERHAVRAASWGLVVVHPPMGDVLRWEPAVVEEQLAAASLGLPVGLDVTGGPAGLARRVLADPHAVDAVLPPFGLVAVEQGRRAVVQQDWLGMCRLFTGSADGVTVLASRPTLVARALGLPLRPDPDAWSSWTMGGHFGADTSPVQGVTLLPPGCRVTGRREEGGGWLLRTEQARTADDLVRQGLELRSSGAALDVAADSIAGVLSGAAALSATHITLGLSGGKDSRLIAASFIGAGVLPKFSTNADTAAEGETASYLMQLLRERRGLSPEHHVFKAGASAVVNSTGLYERVRRLQVQSDFQMPSSYTVRPVAAGNLPAGARSLSFTGSGGELATAYWYPEDDAGDDDEAVGRHYATKRLLVDLGATAEVAAAESVRLDAVAARGLDLGLRGVELCDYVYLIERVRRWYTSAYVVGMVTPLLSPGFVAASFAMTAAQKRQRHLHTALLARYVPEWADVPFVLVSTGRTTAARVWDGDGLQVAADLLDTHDGQMTGLMRRGAVEEAVRAAARGTGNNRHEKVLQQFTWLAVAAETLEPGSVREAELTSYARLTAPPATSRPGTPAAARPAPAVPPALSGIASRLRFVKRLPVAGRAWSRARARLVQARRSGVRGADGSERLVDRSS